VEEGDICIAVSPIPTLGTDGTPTVVVPGVPIKSNRKSVG
jgi:hypothetical protein